MKVPVSVAKNEQLVDLVPYLCEFDIKDIGTDVAYRYKPQDESALAYNLPTGFRVKKNSSDQSVNSKLERSTNATTDHEFAISPRGVELAKGEEIGYFRMGSTVAIVFESPPDIEMRCKPGDKVLVGQRLYD